jgi:protein TonB
MSVPAPLRLVVSRAETAPPLDGALAWRPAPPHAPTHGGNAFLLAAAATLAVHAAVLAWMAMGPVDDAARSAGAAEDLVLLEGIPVEIVTSLPAPEVPPAEAAPESPQEAPPEPVEDLSEPPEEPVAEAPPPEPLTEPPPEVVPEQPPVDPALPTAAAESGELPAQADEPSPIVEPPEDPEPPPDPPVESPPPESLPPTEDTMEAEPPPPDPASVPTPRSKPDRTEVAEAKPEPPKPAEPPPSAASAPASAARSGGAGGGGAAQTAGNAAASAYRAEVAARLAQKRFYPNAARRDRLTGRATVSFTLNASGRVTEARVVRSAGSRILDDAALEMVRRAAPYPPIPRGLGSTITIQAPIGFELPR